ncbi:MAG TPA: flagellar basal body-associated FliL family protein [Thermoguttaceae bacterium]|nr:flagellar basal body-associated FliL family protein [Thermoguttaceae bacterium]
MPDQESAAIEDPFTADNSPHTGGKSSLFAKIKVLLLVVGIVVVECVAAFMILPDATQARTMVQGPLGIEPSGEIPLAENAEEVETDLANQVELDLEQFSVTAFHPISNTTMRIDFVLYGMVSKDDEVEFLDRLEEKRHRFRDEVIMTIRSADIADLTDPTLGLIKRRVLERTNRVLGKPLLKGVIFSEFSFLEQ